MIRGVATAKMLANGDFDCALHNAIEFGIREGVRIEWERVAGIMRLPEAQRCQGTAIHIALHDSRINIDCARGILRNVPTIDADASNVVDIAARRRAFELIEGRYL